MVYHYTDTGSAALNQQLFAGAGIDSTPFGTGLATTLEKLPPYEGVTYSAAWWSPAELLELQIRAASAGLPFQFDVKHWPTFLSSSLSIKVAKQHLNYSPKNCLLFITSRTGRWVEALSRYGPHGPNPAVSEWEILFLPGTRFEIVSVTLGHATAFCEIELQEVP